MNRIHRKVTILIIFSLFSSISFGDNLFQAKVKADILNIRSGPSIDSKKSGELSDDQLIYIEKGKEFSMLLDGRGYVSNDFISLGEEVSKVKLIENVDVLGLPNKESRVLLSMEKDTEIEVSRYYQGFFQVSIDGKLGFIPVTSTDVGEEKEELSISADNEALLKEFKTHLGKRYAWGQEGPNTFDCSGFTLFIYKKYYKYNLPHSSRSMSKLGTYVDKKDLIFGDLVFFTTDRSGNVNHVGVYIGNGQFIHASSGKGKVIISPINSGFYDETYKWAKRIF
ncbi:MAG: C40 family peptidase [Firmicutes bacterium]|jgi:hypothetical protein|nr:C40 family peptidase [Bacillota bacterium]